jgi:hypothetical protein
MSSRILNVVSVCGADRYGKDRAYDSADWYSVLVKVERLCGTDR